MRHFENPGVSKDSTELIARTLAPELQERLGGRFMADNKAGAKLLELGFKNRASTPEQFTAHQAAEFAPWRRLMESRPMKAD